MAVKEVRSRSQRVLFAVAGLAAFICLAAAEVRVPVGSDREIIIQTDDPSIQVVVQNERIVRIVDTKTNKAWHLDRQNLSLGTAEDNGGLTVALEDGRTIELRREGQKIAAVGLVTKTPGKMPSTRIFNGKDLTGWVVDGAAPGAWAVEDGQLVGRGTGRTGGYLLSERSFENFVLRFEFQVSEGANSGVALRAVPGERHDNSLAIPQHLEVQILDDATRGKAGADNLTGSLYWSRAGNFKVPDRPAGLAPRGQWNSMTIEARGTIVQVSVNGQKVKTTNLDHFAKTIDALPGVQRSRGRIGFQEHTGVVRFRNIEIDELPAALEPPPFLNASNWRGLPHWTIKDGTIAGTLSEKLDHHTFLCSRKTYRDFELKFQVKVTGTGWAGNSGVQIRSTLIDPDRFIVRGPQCDIGTDFWGCLYGERSGGVIRQAAFTAAPVKDDFNDYFIRCVGKHVTIKVNGQTTVDDEFQQLPDEGILAWQLCGDGPMSVVFRNIDLRELNTMNSGFFNGHDLTGWRGLPSYWKVSDGAIIGAPANGVNAHTFLCSRETYRDFELKFKVRRKNGIGNSGVQFRSAIADISRFTVRGPQLEIDSASQRKPPGSVITEPAGNPSILANTDAIASVWRETDFNDVTLRCVAKHVTVTINGVLAVDADFPSMPSEGIIAWQLHGGGFGLQSPEEVIFKDIRFTNLSDSFTALFNGKDMTGWKSHPGSPGDWRIEDGLLVGRGPRKNSLYSQRGDYENFHFRVEAKINTGGNSGQQFRKAFSPEAYGAGYEVQIDADNRGARTGSLFVKGGTAAVRLAESLVPPDTWFTQEVIARDNQIRVLINGAQVVDYVDKDWTWSRGHLALQIYEPDTVVHFRKIEVKELPTSMDPRLVEFWSTYGESVRRTYPSAWTPYPYSPHWRHTPVPLPPPITTPQPQRP